MQISPKFDVEIYSTEEQIRGSSNQKGDFHA